MAALTGLLLGSQLVFTFITGIYFYVMLKAHQGTKKSVKLESKKEIDQLRQMRHIKLSEPLSEKTRPENFDEIIGQENGIKALRAAICGPNPQHVIIYGPPGVGKTAAARVVLDSARKSELSPFADNAPFVEMDATILQFDERSIADPLIGSVHDPIYQGAGAYGTAGVPQPRQGAVTKAHGGVLFLDEIGELHSLQMNKLLKVLEDRKVFLSSSYYSVNDPNIPFYVHDVFKNGLPADFRLIGATTRSPEEIPPALRSRCTEIFFRQLSNSEIMTIGRNACKKSGFMYDEKILELLSVYSANGRDTVNIVQTAASIAMLDGRKNIILEDVEEVIEHGRYLPKHTKSNISTKENIGVANGLAVFGAGNGILIEIEANAEVATNKGTGSLRVTGIIEEEELNNSYGKAIRTSAAKNSIENVLTVLRKNCSLETRDYDIHINFPGGTPIDGPSAGITTLCALYSSITGKPVSSSIAMTGEITIKGRIAPVGGVMAKIEAAVEAGMDKIIIPESNMQKAFDRFSIEIIYVETVKQAIDVVFDENRKKTTEIPQTFGTILTATSL